jgi:hypothetical protein
VQGHLDIVQCEQGRREILEVGDDDRVGVTYDDRGQYVAVVGGGEREPLQFSSNRDAAVHSTPSCGKRSASCRRFFAR